MPKVRRHNVPPLLLEHLRARMFEREISPQQLRLLAEWLDLEPEVPMGQ